MRVAIAGSGLAGEAVFRRVNRVPASSVYRTVRNAALVREN
jgi:hypothetical protein